jgi:GGDEF domain-containing protein
MKALLMPALFLLVLAVLLHSGLFVPAIKLVGYAFCSACTAGVLLSWRFHSARVFAAIVVLFLAQQGVSYFSFGALQGSHSATTAVFAVGLLLPLDFALISFQQERGFGLSNLGGGAVFLFVECVVVAVLCRPEPMAAANHALHHARLPLPLPSAVRLAFGAAVAVLLIRYLLLRKPAEIGLVWALGACFLALRFGGSGRIPSVYFTAAAFFLTAAVVETSYLLAYHDELTSLPSRRAFNDALLGLVAPYSIAMVDIDHFKRCNDTYGHDTGDQVLRMVASRLARVSGGGEAYRCGGEEFAILFPGKMTAEIVEHLENLRGDVEASRLRLRGPDRRQQARGPDRRNQRASRRVQTGREIRELSRRSNSSEISVTVSIGVASSRDKTEPLEVIQAADKALYSAKAGGRNRVETASIAARRVRRATAGIA